MHLLSKPWRPQRTAANIRTIPTRWDAAITFGFSFKSGDTNNPVHNSICIWSLFCVGKTQWSPSQWRQFTEFNSPQQILNVYTRLETFNTDLSLNFRGLIFTRSPQSKRLAGIVTFFTARQANSWCLLYRRLPIAVNDIRFNRKHIC